jgi:hypothetical protein
MDKYVGVALKARLEAESDYETAIKGNVIGLLTRIRDLTHETDESRYPAVIDIFKRMLDLK